MKTYTGTMVWPVLCFSIFAVLLIQNCSGWKELNTRDKQETEWQPGVEEINAMEDMAVDVTGSDIMDIVDAADYGFNSVPAIQFSELDKEIIEGIDLQYLESLVNRISEYEDMKKKRSLRADDIAKIGKQKSLHDQIILEIELCELKISNTKQLYNAASVMIDGAILEAAALPKYFESEKEF